jgi:circadian clock protein KaiC
MLTRFVDFLKNQQITVIFTAAITEKLIEQNPSDEGISSMVDTWIMVQDAEFESERKRTCTIMKSRGMRHSKMVKQFEIANKGISLSPIPKEETKDRDNSNSAKE